MTRQTIGAFLASLRREFGYTQEEVAEKLGISNRTLSAWETEKRYPDILLLPALAALYNVTVDEILQGERRNAQPAAEKGTEPPAPQEEPPRTGADEAERSVLRAGLARHATQCYVLGGVCCAAVVVLFLSFLLATAGMSTGGIVLFVLALATLVVCIAVRGALAAGAKLVAGSSRTPLANTYRLLLRRMTLRSLSILMAVVLGVDVFVIFFFVYNGSGNIIALIVGLVAAAVAVIASEFALISAGRQWGNPVDVAASERNGSRLKKVVGFGSIPVALALVAMVLFGVWRPVVTETLLRADKAEFTVRLETVALTDEWSVVKDGYVEAGEYEFAVAEICSGEAFKQVYSLGNGFKIIENGIDGWLELCFVSDEGTEDENWHTLLLAERLTLPDGSKACNLRFSQETYPDGWAEVEFTVGYSVTPSVIDEVFEIDGQYALVRTTYYSVFPLAEGIFILVFVLDALLCTALYCVRRESLKAEL